MSTQSIRERSIDTIYNDTFNDLEKEAFKYWTNKYYLIDTPNMDKLNHNFLILETICSENCEVIDFIEKKLSGVLDLPKRKTSKVRRIEYEINCNGDVLEDNDAECCDWKSIEW